MHSLRYFFGEAMTSLRRGRASNLVAVATIAVALFVFGAFVLVTSSLDRLMARWNTVAEMSVYLAEDATAEQRAAIEAALKTDRIVEGREYVSKDEAARRFRRDFPDLRAAADGLGSNPFPASLEVRLRPAAMPAGEVGRLARSIAQLPGVSDVQYDRQWLDRLARVITIVRWVGLALAAALAVAAGLTIAAVVRLALVGRRDEVEIMQLVGAPIGVIRAPFVLEGVLLGGVGAVVALLALALGVAILRARIPADAATLVEFLPPLSSAALALGGALVGCVGGLIATRVVR